jgi:hypothetical protein
MVGLDSAREALRHRLEGLVRLKEQGEPVTGLSSVVLGGSRGSGRRALARVYGRCLAELGVLSTGAVHHLRLSDVPARWPQQAAAYVSAAFSEAEGGLLVAELGPVFTERTAAEQARVVDALAVAAGETSGVPVVLYGDHVPVVDLLRRHTALAGCFSEYLRLPDYSADQLAELALRHFLVHGYDVADAAERELARLFGDTRPADGVRGVHLLVTRIASRAESRTISAADLPVAASAVAVPPREAAGFPAVVT